MKTLKINNNHFQECDVVMLPALKESRIEKYEGSLNDEYLVLDRIPNKGRGNSVFKPQHLYILSNDEIKEGDWYVNSGGCLFQAIKYLPLSTDRKIIATTDTSLKSYNQEYDPRSKTGREWLYLPQIPQSFIEYFITEFDEGNVITKVMVEYSERDYDFGYQALIVNQNNEISILTRQPVLYKNQEGVNHLEWIYDRLVNVHGENPNFDYMLKLKEISETEMYSREEVINLFSKFQYDYSQWVLKMENDLEGRPIPTKWIQEILK
jgi:hypothetical protein